ncbi:MAG: serine/threonine protein kinase [Nannocystis sp.]|nr:serine/threonine protein kinase [Nannocystis sp.]
MDLPGDVSDADTRLAGPSSDDASSLTRRVDGDREEAAAAAPVTAFASEALPAIIRARLQVRGDARLGRYLVLRVLGEGGMGIVFSAYDEELDRRVAIKVLSTRAAGGTSGRARIRREAQALARLSHPNIVQIYEVGEDNGQVYLVMEMIEGMSLRQWWRAEVRGWQEVVGRYLEAGRGLAAAHAAGLVHRDFKPDNAIVGRDGRVRVVDFGLARAGPEAAPTPSTIEMSDSGDTLTVAGTLLGTPAYMAPEQHLRQPADHRADVFAFSVALYEALYGERPFAGRGEALSRAILAGEVREAPAGSRVPAWLRRVLVRGLASDPAERWPAMEPLLAALADDPMLRRRRGIGLGALAVGAAVAGALLRPVALDAPPCEGIDAAFVGAWDEARAAALGEALLASGVPHAAGTWARARALLDAHARAIPAAAVEACEDAHVHGRHSVELADRRLACLHALEGEHAALVESLAGGGAEAVESVIAAVAALTPIDACDPAALTADRTAPPRDAVIVAEVAAVRAELARIKEMTDAGRPREVIAAAKAAIDRAEAVDYPPLHAEAHLRRALLHDKLGDHAAAEGEYTAAWWIALASDHDEVARKTASHLGRMLADEVSRLGEARVWIENAAALARRAGTTARDDLFRLRSLANLDETAGRYADARARLEEALALAVASFGADSPEATELHEGLADVLRLAGDYRRAIDHAERALAGIRALHGDDHPKLAAVYQQEGMLLDDLGEVERAEAATRRSLELLERAYGPQSPNLAFSLNDLGTGLCSRGRLDDGVAALERARDLRVTALGREHMLVTTVLYNLGSCLDALDRDDEARALYEETLAIRERLVGADHPKAAFPHLGLGELALEAGDLDRAEHHLRRALAIREQSLGPEHMRVAFPLVGLAELELRRGARAEALALAERALRLHERTTQSERELARERFAVAQALGEAPTERARARALAGQARAGYEAVGALKAEERARIDAWLADHPAP